jgi:hypothetical protein
MFDADLATINARWTSKTRSNQRLVDPPPGSFAGAKGMEFFANNDEGAGLYKKFDQNLGNGEICEQQFCLFLIFVFLWGVVLGVVYFVLIDMRMYVYYQQGSQNHHSGPRVTLVLYFFYPNFRIFVIKKTFVYRSDGILHQPIILKELLESNQMVVLVCDSDRK